MKERPIIFNGDMVRAILDGKKTQTRRLLNPQPTREGLHTAYYSNGIPVDYRNCPYGQPGDRLWVKEAFKVGAWRNDGRICFDYKASPEIVAKPWCTPTSEEFEKYAHQSNADCHFAEQPTDGDRYVWQPGESPCRWRPSTHMPRWASRITIEITDVRVERVQEISGPDISAEGICLKNLWSVEYGPTSLDQFRGIWSSIYPDSWERNDWVWVLEFRTIKGGEK